MEIINLKTDLKPFYLILFYQNPAWWDIMGWNIQRAIQDDQEDYLGPKSDYFPPHIELYLGPQNIYRACPPKICWESIDDIIKRGDRVKIFRPTFRNFTQADADEMIRLFTTPQDFTLEGIARTETIIGSPYDTMTDILIGLSGILGHPNQTTLNWDSGSKLVCSVGSRLAFDLYNKIHGNLPKLFQEIKAQAFYDAKWGSEIMNSYANGQPLGILDTPPAIFANTQTHFAGEFEIAGQNF